VGDAYATICVGVDQESDSGALTEPCRDWWGSPRNWDVHGYRLAGADQLAVQRDVLDGGSG
jgi:hypothetical protein